MIDMTEAERLFARWCGMDPSCDPGLTPAQLQRVLCFAEYVRSGVGEFAANPNRDKSDAAHELLAALKALVGSFERLVWAESSDGSEFTESAELRAARDLIARIEAP
jgi:hypothetical protein